ncbi:MAG TPA: carbohydrate ABC transporter permease [Spirochaetales bacterium]|nr:carbohydrate ABC transporter permease [Spirochaetales bacterium]
MKRTSGEKLFSGLNYTLMGLLALTMLLPLLHILQLTFSAHPDTSFRLWPRQLTLENYRYVLEAGFILRPLWNSIFLSTTGTIFSLAMTSLLAYPLADPDLPARRFFNFLVVLTIMINIGFLPKYLLIRDLRLMNSYWSIVLVGGISSFNLIIMRNYFQSIPRELFDSARIDGATERTIMIRIVLPLALPVMATIFLFYFVDYWNEYFRIILYITDRTKYTLQVILRSIIIMEEDMGGDELDRMLIDNIKYTTVIVALIPIMMLYPFLQRYFTKGIMLGSIKG